MIEGTGRKRVEGWWGRNQGQSGVRGSGFRVQGSGFRVFEFWSFGFRPSFSQAVNDLPQFNHRFAAKTRIQGQGDKMAWGFVHPSSLIPHPFEEPGTGGFQKKWAVSKQRPGHCFPVAVFSLPLASRKMYTFEWIEDPINRGETEEQSKPTQFGLLHNTSR